MKNMLPDYSSDTDYGMLTKETASYALKTRTTTTTTTSPSTTTSHTSPTTPVSKTTRTKVTPFEWRPEMGLEMFCCGDKHNVVRAHPTECSLWFRIRKFNIQWVYLYRSATPLKICRNF